jgi:hypothetical protein
MRIQHSWIVFLLAFFLMFSYLQAQSNCSYVVVSTGGYTLAQVDAAFSGADLDAYRKKTIRRSMTFSNGAEVQLLSASEMQTMNCPVNGLLAMDDNTPLDPNRRFEIHPSGVIFESVQAVYKR